MSRWSKSGCRDAITPSCSACPRPTISNASSFESSHKTRAGRACRARPAPLDVTPLFQGRRRSSLLQRRIHGRPRHGQSHLSCPPGHVDGCGRDDAGRSADRRCLSRHQRRRHRAGPAVPAAVHAAPAAAVEAWLARNHSSNWATTDSICGYLIGPLVLAHPSLVPRVARGRATATCGCGGRRPSA